jgi:hypothetical protein
MSDPAGYEDQYSQACKQTKISIRVYHSEPDLARLERAVKKWLENKGDSNKVSGEQG